MDQKNQYVALVLACIDPRMQEPVYKYLEKRNLTGKYSQVVIAGAAIGAVAPRFEEWHQTFWQNLGISVGLHKIHKVIVIQHRDCGAAREAYGDFTPGSEHETNLHRTTLADFRNQLLKHQPQLDVETLLMDLDGSIEDLS